MVCNVCCPQESHQLCISCTHRGLRTEDCWAVFLTFSNNSNNNCLSLSLKKSTLPSFTHNSILWCWIRNAITLKGFDVHVLRSTLLSLCLPVMLPTAKKKIWKGFFEFVVSRKAKNKLYIPHLEERSLCFSWIFSLSVVGAVWSCASRSCASGVVLVDVNSFCGQWNL